MTLEVRDRIEHLRHGKVPEGYKKTRSGIVPIDWTEACLGDIYTERKEPGNENLPLLMVSIHSGVSDGEVDEDELPKKVKRIEDKSQYKRAAKGDLVFNMMRAWQGAIGTVRTEGMVSPAYIVAEPNDMVDPLFMDYYMKTNRMVQTIHRQSYGVTDFRLRLYWDSFAPIQCVLPSVKEQKKIAEILTTQDKVIELKEKQLAEKQRQKKYLMQQLLTKKPRDDGKWNSVRMADVCTINPRNEATDEETVTFLRMSDVSENGRILKHSLINGASIGGGFTPFKRGDILVAKITPCFENGKGASTDDLKTEHGFGSTEFHVLRCRDGINNRFLFYHTQYDLFRKKLEKEMSGSAGQKRVQASSILRYEFTLPDLNIQNEIVKTISTLDNEIDLIWQGTEQEKQKKRALMQLLLTGIVRVKV